jgi:hypothetical protein
VSRFEIAFELLLPATWLTMSIVVAAAGHPFAALPVSFIFFLTGLRLVHNAFHSVLGLPRRVTSGILWLLSLVMLGSMHAVRFNHLRHHRHLMNERDVEARSAGMSWYGALLFGPVFPLLLTWTALTEGNSRLRLAVLGQLLVNGGWLRPAGTGACEPSRGSMPLPGSSGSILARCWSSPEGRIQRGRRMKRRPFPHVVPTISAIGVSQ